MYIRSSLWFRIGEGICWTGLKVFIWILFDFSSAIYDTCRVLSRDKPPFGLCSREFSAEDAGNRSIFPAPKFRALEFIGFSGEKDRLERSFPAAVAALSSINWKSSDSVIIPHLENEIENPSAKSLKFKEKRETQRAETQTERNFRNNWKRRRSARGRTGWGNVIAAVKQWSMGCERGERQMRRGPGSGAQGTGPVGAPRGWNGPYAESDIISVSPGVFPSLFFLLPSWRAPPPGPRRGTPTPAEEPSARSGSGSRRWKSPRWHRSRENVSSTMAPGSLVSFNFPSFPFPFSFFDADLTSAFTSYTEPSVGRVRGLLNSTRTRIHHAVTWIGNLTSSQTDTTQHIINNISNIICYNSCSLL